MADCIWMAFLVVGRLGTMTQADGGANRPTGMGNFEGGYGLPHCNQWGLSA